MYSYGLIGEKLGHSYSPQIHQIIFDCTDVSDGSYRLFELTLEQAQNIRPLLKEWAVDGINVTIPYKETVMPQLDGISPEAKAIGSVNTIRVQDGMLYGYNTDYFGFGAMLQVNGMSPRGKDAYVLGNGGAAKAVIAYLLDNGVKSLRLVSRNRRPFQGDVDIEVIDYEMLANSAADGLLVNTTPVGMYPNTGESPIGKEVVEKFDMVADLIYNPAQTELLQLAESLQIPCCNGLYMLIGQAVKAHEIWRGKTFSADLIPQIDLLMKGGEHYD